MKILGLSGHKQAGKDTAANFILGVHLISYGIVRGNFQITPQGALFVSDINGEENTNGILNQNCITDEIYTWYQTNIWPYVKYYSFADPLKQLCIQILGLTVEQCYGTNQQKDSLTNLKWENMPNVDSDKSGFMTAREILQHVGTNIFRKMYPDVWVDATLRQIQIEQPQLVIIKDVRFPNEVEGVQKMGGKVIRFTRSLYTDKHDSETKLDKENFDWNKFDGIIDNSEMDISKQNEAVYNLLRPWDYIPELEV